MANVIVASSSKSLIPKTKLPTLPKLPSLPTTSAITTLRLPSFKSLTTPLKTLTTASVLSLPYLLPHPSLAADIEKAALFDFNLTLPIIAAEFLLLMFALDKIYYSPLGNFMDERDAMIKKKLAEVQGSSEEVKQLEEQANAIMRAARAEVAAAMNKMRKETSVEVEKMLAEGRAKVEVEVKEALENLERQKEATIKALDAQTKALSEDIVKKVLPAP